VTPVVYAFGTFDLFHAGHVLFLQACAAHGDTYVALDADGVVAGRPPYATLVERLTVVKACRYVKKVVVNQGDPRALIEKHRPDYIAHGGDWHGGQILNRLKIDQGWLDENRCELLFVQPMTGMTTAQLVERIRAR
jgi:cytidyltransferase-like protein